jgi:predicted  nucleic acid-binding Zn-ribbon protein
MNSDEIRKRLESSQRAIELADRTIKQIDETLRDSRERTERAFAELRRAGYLR